MPHSQHKGTRGDFYDESGAGSLGSYHLEYNPYGDVQRKEGNSSFVNETLYAGHVKDTGTPFTYMNARYYEPGVACGMACAARVFFDIIPVC